MRKRIIGGAAALALTAGLGLAGLSATGEHSLNSLGAPVGTSDLNSLKTTDLNSLKKSELNSLRASSLNSLSTPDDLNSLSTPDALNSLKKSALNSL